MIVQLTCEMYELKVCIALLSALTEVDYQSSCWYNIGYNNFKHTDTDLASSRSYKIHSSIRIFKSHGYEISIEREIEHQNDQKPCEYERNIEEETIGTMPGTLP